MKRRVLRKPTPGTFAVITGGDAVFIPNNPPNGWAILETTDHFIWYRFDYFDLSGYTLEDETLFPQAVVVQEIQPIAGANVINAHRLDLVTKKIVTTDDLSQIYGSFTIAPPGSMHSRFSLEEVIFGRMQLWTNLVDINNTAGQVQQTQWGTGDATAAEKLYITQAWYLVKSGALPEQALNIPEGAYIIPSLIVKEPDLEYIMRLKRSHELAE